MTYLQQLLNLTPDQLFDELQTLVVSNSVETVRYDQLVALRDELDMLIGNIEADVSSQLEAGLQVDGFKYKDGRKTRIVKDPDQMVNSLTQFVERDNLFETKLLSLTELEKQLTAAGLKPAERDAVLAPHIKVSQGKPKLVRE